MADWRSRWRSFVTGRRDRGAVLSPNEEPVAEAATDSQTAVVDAPAPAAESVGTESATTEAGSGEESAADDARVDDESDERASDDVAAVRIDADTGVAETAATSDTPVGTVEAALAEPSPPEPDVAAEAGTAVAEAAQAEAAVATDTSRAAVASVPTPETDERAGAEDVASPVVETVVETVADRVATLREETRWLEAALREERTRRMQLEEEVAGLSDHDPLTGLASARRFNDRLGVAVIHALREKHKLAIVQLAIDRFDAVREGMGPSHSDDLLRSVALALENTLRQGDTIARLGWEPVLTILLPGVKRDDDVKVIADKLRLALRSPFSIGGSDLLVTASIGMALFPDDGSDTESLLQCAALAMERAREKGGDAWDVHAPGSRARAARRQARETALQRALVRGGLELYWQPVVTCDTGAIVGMESLLRWRGGNRPPAPSDFVALADVSGLAVPLGQWMLRAACRQAGLWRGLGHYNLVVGVGISARQLAHAAFVKLVRRVLDEAGLPASALELAIPESELAAAPAVALERLAEMRVLGIRIALDAFGMPESRLAAPHRYPLDTLRIDASIVRDAVTSADHAAVIRACVVLARSRRLRVVAPGADTENHRALLVRLRCDQMRGRLCGAPMPAAEAEGALGAGSDLSKTRTGGTPGRSLL
jgi:diguanylate cyclase (GGDEF)-like protein